MELGTYIQNTWEDIGRNLGKETGVEVVGFSEAIWKESQKGLENNQGSFKIPPSSAYKFQGSDKTRWF